MIDARVTLSGNQRRFVARAVTRVRGTKCSLNSEPTWQRRARSTMAPTAILHPTHLASKTGSLPVFCAIVLLGTLLGGGVARANDAIRELTRQFGKTPALVVVVCGGDEQAAAAITQLVEQTPWTIFCRGAKSAELDKIRAWAEDNRLLGKRVYVADDTGSSLWLAGDMADAVWVLPGVAAAPAEEEIMRVLHPGGISIAAGKVTWKPADSRLDQWRHPYHGPDNNVVSQDLVASLPGELRFQTNPTFAPMPNQTLFSGGRIFFFTGHIAFHEREEPLLNTLTVLNAYNGLRLWSRSLDPSCVVHNFTKLATADEVVFAEGGTLWVLDAATGEERGKFPVPAEAASEGDTDWKWIVQEGNVLWAAFGPPDGRVTPFRLKRQMGHWPWEVADMQYRVIVDNFGAARRLAAFQYPEMKPLWSIQESDPFDVRALCLEGERIFQLAPSKYVAARDAGTGEQLWRSTPATSPGLLEAIGAAIKRQGWGLGWATYCCARAHDGVLCIAGPPFKKTIGVGLEKGQLLWVSDIQSPHPFFCKDALYVMPRVAAPAAGCRKLDPLTGELLDEFSLGVIGSCTRLTVTPNQFFYRPGGGEGRTVYFDLSAQQLANYEGVVRPGCFDGVVPANGRLYWMPLACDCWQVHGTFSMAPRVTIKPADRPAESPPWTTPTSSEPATAKDWPMFRATAAGTATVAASVGRQARELWRRQLSSENLSAPTVVANRVFVGGSDGTVSALNSTDGKTLWRATSHSAVLYPPAYWNGRVVFGSCDGSLYCLDATNGRILGRVEMAPEKRFINIMDQFMSAWPLGGGVVVNNDGLAFSAAGSTAADGAEVLAVDLATGKPRWRQTYTMDRKEPRLSFGVQGNILLRDNTLFINGGAPVGIVALDAETGGKPQIVARLEAGREMFLDPDGQPLCCGPELYSSQWARTTIFKRHQGRVYFQLSGRQVALVDGRLFCSDDSQALDRIVDLMNKDPKSGGALSAATAPWDVMQLPVDAAILWAGKSADVLGLAMGTDGLVALHKDSAEGISTEGQSLWRVPLPATPVRWGVALADAQCVITLTDGHIVCLDLSDAKD